MKGSKAILAVIAGAGLATLGLWFGGALASSGEPGSATDPLVSKSYVDALVLFQVVNVPKDSALIGEGGTEIVLRAGQAVALSSESGGLLDVTGGTDLEKDTAIVKNHMLVVPRTDGRGVAAKTDIVLMVKGGFEIKKLGE